MKLEGLFLHENREPPVGFHQFFNSLVASTDADNEARACLVLEGESGALAVFLQYLENVREAVVHEADFSQLLENGCHLLQLFAELIEQHHVG